MEFIFDQEAFELEQGDSLADMGENIVVGGTNQWAYDSFVNVSTNLTYGTGGKSLLLSIIFISLNHSFFSSGISSPRDGLINHRDPFLFISRRHKHLGISGIRALNSLQLLLKKLCKRCHARTGTLLSGSL